MEPLPAAVRAATRSGDTALCLIHEYPALSLSVDGAQLLPPLAAFCGGCRRGGTPEANRALQRLAELAPSDPWLPSRAPSTRC